MCWNAMMAVSVCGDHPSNVLTIRGGWGPYILPPDWTRAPHAVLWLVSSWPRGHTWTRGTGDLVLTAARNVTLCRDIFISSSPASSDGILQTLATLQTPWLFGALVCLTPGPLASIAHQAVALLVRPGHSSLTPVFARSYHPQHQNVQSSIKSQR